MKTLEWDAVPSELAEALAWLKNAIAIDDEYIQRWEIGSWAAWHEAMRTSGEDPNPVVPKWMQPIIHERWHNDFSAPAPYVAQYMLTGNDWFADAAQHPEMELFVDETPGEDVPTLAQLAAGWEHAVSRGATPVTVTNVYRVGPWDSVNVVLEIDAFYVVGEKVTDELGEELGRIFGRPASRRTAIKVSDDEWAEFGPAASTNVLAWDWMYG